VGALRIASFGIAYFGIASFGIASFEFASFSTKGSNCFLCGGLASFEYGCIFNSNNGSRAMFHVFVRTHMILSPATANDQYWPCGGGGSTQ
jgi:hypothetical protein